MDREEAAGRARALARRARDELVTRRSTLVPGRARGRTPAPVRAARLLDARDRLVPSPTFLFSSVRSGSTLLRAILDSHSQICAPHEMHLVELRMNLPTANLVAAVKHLGLSSRELENLMWDRVLHLQLAKSKKTIIVDKTPRNTREWRRIHRSWPDARYIFLLRHPVRIAASLAKNRPDVEIGEHYAEVNRYAKALHESMSALPGHTVRYEELTTHPAQVSRDVCLFLGVPWEESMLQYRAVDRGRYRRGLGDWSPKIKSGVIVAAPPDPQSAEIPAELRASCALLGYL